MFCALDCGLLERLAFLIILGSPTPCRPAKPTQHPAVVEGVSPAVGAHGPLEHTGIPETHVERRKLCV